MKADARQLLAALAEPAIPAPPRRFCFGACDVDVAAREVRLHGKACRVGPKVFDLLVFLIERRNRVVTQEEMRAALWRGLVVSDTVLSRTVMKARQAIGDAATPPHWIRAVYGRGYRFWGEGVEVVAPSGPDLSQDRPPAERPALRIGLLPFEDLTGERHHGWVRLGLPALVGQALQADRRLAVVSGNDLARALEAVSAGRVTPRGVQQLCGSFALQHAVQGALRRGGAGLVLDYRLLSADGASETRRGTLEGSDAVVLGERLAAFLEEALFPSPQVVNAFESRDAFALEAFERARQANEHGRRSEALHLLQVVLDIEPASSAARLQYLRTLCNEGDPRMLAYGQTLLSDATEAGDTRMQGMVHMTLGHALGYDGSRVAQARHHRAQALLLAALHDGEAWVADVCLMHAIGAHIANDFGAAREFYARTERACQASGNGAQLAHVLGNRALLDLEEGRTLQARDTLQESVRLYRECGLDYRAAAPLSSMAAVNAGLGLMDLALRQCREAVGGLQACRDDDMVLSVLMDVLKVYAEQGAIEDADHALAMAGWLDDERALSAQARLAMIRGLRELMAGQVDAARGLLRRAVDLARDAGFDMYADQWLPYLLELELRCDDGAAARGVIGEIEAGGSGSRDAGLRAAVLHGRAALLHDDGDATGARAALAAAARQAPGTRAGARAALDAAWLCIEADDHDGAHAWLRGLDAWRREHPFGLAVDARLAAGQGRWPQAVAAQLRGLELRGPAGSAYHRQLLDRYRAAGSAIAAVPRLASLL